MQDLIWHNYSFLSIRRRNNDLIDISEEEKSKIFSFFSTHLSTEQPPKVLPPTSQSKLYMIMLKNMSTIERNPVLTRALQSQNFAEYRMYHGLAAPQAIEDEIHDFCLHVKRSGTLRSTLVLIKSLLSLVEVNQSQGCLVNPQVFNFGNMFFLPGPDDLKSILGHIMEQDRLSTFCSYPRFVPTHGTVEKMKPLEFSGPVTGFIGGVSFCTSDLQYFEGIVKGAQPMRIGWELVQERKQSEINQSLLPGDTQFSWAFDGYSGALYHDAITVKVNREPFHGSHNSISLPKSPKPCNTQKAELETSDKMDVKLDTDPRYSPFVKLLRIGIPKPAVEQRMTQGGFSDEEIQQFLSSIGSSQPSDHQDTLYFGNLFNETNLEASLQTVAEEAYASGGYLLMESNAQLSICPEPNDFQNRQYTPWKVGDVVGCLLDPKCRLIRFFLNNVEHGQFSIPSIPDDWIFRPVSSGAPGSGFQFRIPSHEHSPDWLKPLLQNSQIENSCLSTNYYLPFAAPDTPNHRQLSVCLRLDESVDGAGYILCNPKVLEKISSTHSFCLEISARLDGFQVGKRHLYTLFSFTGKNSAHVNKIGVTESGSVLCEMFGRQYRSHDGAIKSNKWHHISIVYSTSRSSVACVIDKVVHSLTKQEEVPIDLSQKYESIFCVGGLVKFEIPTSLPSKASVPNLEEKEDSETVGENLEPNTESCCKMIEVDCTWIGGVCDIRLWTASRSMQDITETSSRKVLTGSEKRLCGFWRLDEGSGNIAHDSAQVDSNWSPAHGNLIGNCRWCLYNPLNDLPANPLDLDNEPDTNQEPEATFRTAVPQDQSLFSIQQALISISQKLYNASSHLLGWRIGKGPKVMSSSKYYDIQLKSPGYQMISDPHVLTFLFLNSCFRQLLRLSVDPVIHSLDQKAVLTISISLLRILLVNFNIMKEKKIPASSLGLKYSNRNSENSSQPFVAQLLISLLCFLQISDTKEGEVSLSELKVHLRVESIRVIIAGFSIFFPHVADQALLLHCLLIRKHSSHASFPWNSISVEIKRILDVYERTEIDFTALPSDPLAILQKLSNPCLVDLLVAVCDWMTKANGEDDFVQKFLPRGCIPNLPVPSQSNSDGSIQIGDIVVRGKDWHYGDEDGGAGSRGVVVHLFSWLDLFPKCGVTVRWPNGKKNSYCYGCQFTTHTSEIRYELSLAKIGDSMRQNDPEVLSPHRETISKKELLYTPDDVRQSLLEEVGGLTKRVVLRYMKATAPMDWQTSRKLSWTENTLVSKLSAEEVSTLYADFYETFSPNSKLIKTSSTFATSLTVDEPEDIVSSRFSSILEILLFDIESDPGDDSSLTPTYNLLSVLQSYLTGQYYELSDNLTDTKSICEVELCVKPREDRILKISSLKACPEHSNQLILWNWDLGNWKYSSDSDINSKSPMLEMSSSSQARYLNITFDSSKLGKNLTLSEDSHSLVQKTSRKWSTCISNIPLQPKSGLYRWCVKIESLGRRGHCIFGVASEEVSTNTYLGQDSNGWGLTMNNEIYHGSRSQQPEKTLKLTTNSIVEILFDSNDNILHFTDTTNPTLGTITTKIESGDRTLYPAFSLFSPGDHIIFLSPAELTRLLDVPTTRLSTKTSLEKNKIAGYPPTSLLYFAKILSSSILKMLKSDENKLLSTLRCQLFSVSFPQILASLARWEYILHTPNDIISDLQQILTFFQSNEFGIVSKRFLISESNTTVKQMKHLLDEVAQVSTLIMCLLGRVASTLIYQDHLTLNNHDVAVECQRMQSSLPNRYTTNEVELLSSDGILDWFKSSLFSNGLRDRTEIEYPTTIADLLNTFQSSNGDKTLRSDDLLWDWIAKHDKVSQKIKTIGGSNLSHAIQIVLNALIYHHGYIQSVCVLVDHLESLRNHPSLLSQFMIREPPFFIMQIISVVGKLRFWAMQAHQSQSLAYDHIATKLASRAYFLFDLMPLRTSRPLLLAYVNEFCYGHESFSFLESQTILNLETDSRALSDLVISFLKDSASLILLRVGLKTATHRAIERSEGFSLLSHALSSAAHFPGWIQKVALLSHLPLAMRGDSSCLFFSSPAPQVRTVYSPGNYMSGLETCNSNLKTSVRGSFYTLYTLLTSELAIARSNGDTPLILLILNCWGLLIDADDHDMLARVKIFHVLQDILEIKTPSLQQEQGSNTVTRAAMKVFYLLALQIASISESKLQNPEAALSSPVLVRARSGPSTLSEVVFDMLFNQIQSVLSALRLQLLDLAHHNEIMFVQISEENFIILNESTLLLTCVSKDSSCQKILSSASWLSLLLEISLKCPTVCQQRALRILSDVLPANSPHLFHNFDPTILPGFDVSLQEDCIPIWYVSQLLDMAGRLFHSSPQYCLSSAEEKLNDLSPPAFLEVTSEVVALIRILLGSSTWQPIIEEILLSYLTLALSPNVDYMASTKIIAAFSVLGGHVDSCYPGGLVEILPTKSEQAKLGVIISSNMNNELIELVIVSDSDGHSTFMTPSELRNSKKPSSSRRPILTSQERIRGINRCPISDTILSPMLIETLLRAVISLNLSTEINSKTTSDNLEGKFDTFFSPQYMTFLGCRAVSSLAASERTSLVLHLIFRNMLESESSHLDPSFSKSFLSYIRLGLNLTTTAGIPDIPLLETQMMLFISQRNKQARQTQFEKLKSVEISLDSSHDKQSLLQTTSLPCDTPLSGESHENDKSDPLRHSSSPLSVEDESKDDKWQPPSNYIDIGGGILAQDPNSVPQDTEDLPEPSQQMAESSMFESDWNINPEDSQPYEDEAYNDGNVLMIEQLEQMGFPRRWCELALALCGYDLGEALNYILANGDSLDSMASSESKINEITSNVTIEKSNVPVNHDEERSSYPFGDNLDPASLSSPKDYHYSEKRTTLFPIYVSPDFGSQRLGALFPGDDIVAVEELFTKTYESGLYPQWVKVYFADYQEEICEENEDDEYLFPDDRSKPSHEYAWIPTHDEGIKVVFPGVANPSEGLPPLADPPCNFFPVRYKIQVTYPRGLTIRQSFRKSSDTVGTLTDSTVATVVEETFDSEGAICWRISEPFPGWIYHKSGCCEILEILPLNDPKDANPQDIIANNLTSENPSEWELFDLIDDSMEQWGASDVYRKEDRFFGTQQGLEFKVFNDRLVDHDDESTAHNRRSRILETGTIGNAIKATAALSLEILQQKILSSMQTLTVLHSRQTFLALLLRDMKKLDPSVIFLLLESISLHWGAQELESTPSPITFRTPCRSDVIGVSHISNQQTNGLLNFTEVILTFTRLVLFRGEPYSLSLGFEALAIDDIEALGLQKGLLSIESIVGTLLLQLISHGKLSQNEAFRSFSSLLSEGFLISIVKQLRLACSANYSEHSWLDPNYYDDTDLDCLRHPNLHYAVFLTEILMKYSADDLPTLCNIWCRALRSPSMSVKHIVFQQLEAILCYLSKDDKNNELLRTCLQYIPITRLKAMCARRLWHEMEDQPAYSRYLSALIHLLSLIDASTLQLNIADLQTSVQPTQISSCCPNLHSRSIIEFDSSQKSSVQLTPYKEMKHSWTVEVWIFLLKANDIILPDGHTNVPTVPERLDNQRSQPAHEEIKSLNILPDTQSDMSQDLNSNGERTSLEFPKLVREKSRSNFGPDSLLSQWNQGRPSPFAGFGRSNLSDHQPDWSSPSDWAEPPNGFSFSSGPYPDSDSMNLPDVDAPVFMRSTETLGHESRRGGWRNKSDGSLFGESRSSQMPGVLSSQISPSKVGTVEPAYLLSSSTSYIKLQAGGPISEPVEDPDQISEPVDERAFCLAIGQMGDSEKVFDYVVPVGKWVHISLSCDRNCETVYLYVNGELQSLVHGRFILPQSTIGHSSLGKSFTGQLAELRIWSGNRSSEEVRRDMFANVSECRGLTSLLTFSEGEGNFTVDGVGLSSCRLKNCEWKQVIAPSTQGFLCPKFMLKETEEAEGIFGEGIGESHRVHELTGVIKFIGDIPYHMRTVIDEVGQSVCICYRHLEDSPAQFEGYIEWCELNVRSQIRGSFKNDTNELQFNVVNDQCAVILGPPEKLSWCFGLHFHGHIEDSRLVGNVEVSTVTSFNPPLRQGEIRIDESTIPKGVIFVKEKSKNLEVVTVADGEKSKPFFILAEVFPRSRSNKMLSVIPRDASKLRQWKSDWEAFLNSDTSDIKDDEFDTKDDSGTWKDVVVSSNEEESPLSSPQLKPTMNSFGICSHHDSVWIDWFALASTETILYGVCTHEVAVSTPTYNNLLDNQGCWVYSSKGMIFHGAFSESVEPIQKNDKVSVEIDPRGGRIVFYRNDILVYEFQNLHNQLSCPLNGNIATSGIRPFVFLSSGGDSCSLRTISGNDIEKPFFRRLKYGANDKFGRNSFVFNSLSGTLNGKGVMTYHHGSGFWCGNWYQGLQHGVQLWISSPNELSGSQKFIVTPYLYENNIFISELSHEDAEPWITEWSGELKRAVYRLEQKESKFKLSDIPKYINSEFLAPFNGTGCESSTLDSPSLDVPSIPRYLLKIIYQNGATVRAGIDIDQSRPIRSLNFGDIVEAYKRAVTHDGIPRYQISDGWISGKLRGGAGDAVVQVLEYRPTVPLKYQIIREDGAKIRQGCELDSPEVTVCPFGTIIEVAEKKLQEGPNDSSPTMRLKIISPVEYAGWASEKANIVKLLSEEDGANDSTIKEEMKRRMDVRQQRLEIKSLRETNRRTLEKFPSVPKISLNGTINVSEECFFLLNKSQCNTGLKLSDDFLSVTCESRSSGRPMVLGTRGFSKGVHYWEVQVDSAQWGSVFIGVAPLDSSNWNGYGFINYRATQNSGSETLYGSYYAAGDTVGVLLDMDHGTISFFKDGEDFNVGRTVVINMGVAYHSLRRNHKSSHPILYPCFGMKSSGDQLSIRRCKWASQRGVGPISILDRVLEAKHVLQLWGSDSRITTPQFSENFVSKMYDAYLRWRQHDLVVITSRSGIDVAIDTRIDAVLRAAQPALDICPTLRTGVKVRTPYGSGKIVGARLDELWYILDSEENGAWYWTSDQLIDLISLGAITFDEETVNPVESSSDDTSVEIAIMTSEEFSMNLACSRKSWTNQDDEALVQLVNTYSNKNDCDPLRIPVIDLENYRQRNGILTERTIEEIQTRYTALCVLNRSVQFTLPYLDFGRPMNSLLLTQYDKKVLEKFPICSFKSNTSMSGQIYSHAKRVIFTRTKLKLWKLAVRESTVFTTPPPDEYERPDEIPEITLNRMEAQMAKQMRESLPFSDCLSKSLFGQLYSAIGDWDDSSLRRSFVHMQDAGQPRAFFVKFTGEGVDDHGGPYRAVFETALGEEAEGLLELFTPCSNAKIRTGENRDQSVFNSEYLKQPQKHPLYIHFGKLISLANRHDILISLSLPQIIWKPLVADCLQLSDLRATDLHLLTSLQAIAQNDVPLEDVYDMLMQLLLACSLPHHIVIKLLNVSSNGGDMTSSSERIRQICALINQLHLVAHKPGLHLVYKGMSTVLPTELFSLFTSNELEILFCGEPDVDIPLLQKVTEYEGVSPTDK